MSLVEKALKKLQENRQQQPETPPPIAPVSIAKIVEQQRSRAIATDPSTPPLLPSAHARVVQVDRAALRHTGFLPPDHQEREIADQYRSIKRALIRAADDQPAGSSSHRAIMLTSALPGDGKTFTCINLAFSLALERDISVILVDGDVAKPHLSTLFGIVDEPGLLDVLGDSTRDIASVILPTNVSNLYLIPAGTRSDEAAELLASQRMTEILARLIGAQSKVLVVFDSPPMLVTSEARALAGSMGQIVVVVKADVTPQQAVLETLDVLGKAGSVSLVLNQVPQSAKTGYYYGYAYGKSAKSVAPEQQSATTQN